MEQFSPQDVAETVISPTAMRIVKLLVGNEPRTIADLVDETGVTRTAVTEQLNELVAGGLAEKTTERVAGRGRPRYLYQATHATLLLLFAGNQQLVVPAMWEAIAHVGGEEFSKKVLRRVSRTMANHYKQRITGKTPGERLTQLGRLLQQEGVLVDVEKRAKGELVLHKRSCPFVSMYEDSAAVCCVDQQMFRLVVGAPVNRVNCRHEGDPCCSFAVKKKRKKSSNDR